MNDTYTDVCSSIENTPKNTGAGSQCLEAVTVMIYLLKQGFAFDSVEDFKSKTKWEEAVTAKNAVPLYEMYELTPNNTEAVFYESRNFRKETSKAVKITDWEAYLGFCSHSALKSYENSEYSRVVEVTDDGDLIGIYAPDGIGVTGQLLSQFEVGIRVIATSEKPAYSPVTMTYDNYEELEEGAVFVTPDFNPVTGLEGVFDINITQSGSATSSLVTFTAFAGCNNVVVAGLETIIVLLDDSGIEQAGVAVADVGNGTYTATATASIVSGTISTNGVQTLPLWGDLLVEGSAPVVVTP